MTKRTVLITGATAGIGQATAEEFARQGHRLILTGRRKERLEQIADFLNEEYGTEIMTLHFDVRDRETTFRVLGNLPEEWRKVDVLVNNAGLASGKDTVEDADPTDWDRMIDTNVKGLLNVSKAIIPGMKERKKGDIVHIGSIAGKQSYAKGNVYCATKHAVEAISKGMRIDLLRFGIRVTNICPGAAETEFSLVRFHGDEEKAENVYKGYQPLMAKDVADAIYFAVSRPPHVCINDLLIMPTAQADSHHFYKPG